MTSGDGEAIRALAEALWPYIREFIRAETERVSEPKPDTPAPSGQPHEPIEWKITTPPGELRFYPTHSIDRDNLSREASIALFRRMRATFTRPNEGWMRPEFMRVLELSRGCGDLVELLPESGRAEINGLRSRVEAIAEEKGVGS